MDRFAICMSTAAIRYLSPMWSKFMSMKIRKKSRCCFLGTAAMLRYAGMLLFRVYGSIFIDDDFVFIALFSLWGVVPPHTRLTPVHKIGDRHQHIKHARIFSFSKGVTKLHIKLIGVLVYEIFRAGDSDRSQIMGNRFTDIGKVGHL